MTKLYSFVLAFFILILSTAEAATELKGEKAEAICSNCQTVWAKDYLQIPSFIRFKHNQGLEPDEAIEWITNQFEIAKDLRFVPVKEYEDHTAFRHIRLQQYLGDFPIEFAEYTLHIKNGKVVSISGDIHQSINIQPSVTLSEADAIESAKNHVNAKVYKWDVPGEDEELKIITHNANATYFPQPELVILADGANVVDPVWQTAYKMRIYAHQPESHSEIFIQAVDGSVVFEHQLIHTADTNGTAISGYSDTVNIVADSFVGGFRLYEKGRGRGIHTRNLETRTQSNSYVEFTDADNYWANFNPQLDQYATDAHWGAEMTYDYLLINFNRNSIDNNGYQLTSYVHYDENWSNASWNGFSMRYGDGNNNPFTTLDIAGHEIAHGLTSNSARLVYQDESGALNESFSDIFGASIEFFGKPNDANWRIGEDRGNAIRSMSNPRLYNDPSTYQGFSWVTGPGDNGGVHTNSGVQNFWYYLLTEGGTGKNDNDSLYDVSGIGIDDAAQIAYRNLVVYLSPLSNYEDAAFYSTQAAIDLYGSCSEQHKQTVNAWFACGIGERFIDGAISDFYAEQTTSCQVPFLAKFTNLSANAVSYNWDFGNGTSSTLETPEALFTAPGKYSIKLVIDGADCGMDSVVKADFININPLEAPLVEADTLMLCPGESAKLSASGNGESIRWYNSLDAGQILFEGEEFETDVLNADADFFAETFLSFETKKVGPGNNEFADNSNSSTDVGMLFDVFSPMVLESVLIFAGGAKERTIAVMNSKDEKIHEKTMMIEDGPQRVYLGFELEPGANYELKFTSSGSNASRVTDFANYPYEAPGICMITGNTAPPQNYYFYFFDWEVRLLDCSSTRTQIHASVACITPETPAFNGYSIYPNPSSSGFTIEYINANEDYLEVKMYNTNGQLIREFDRLELTEGKKEAFLSTSGIAPGVYYLSIVSSVESATERVMISN